MTRYLIRTRLAGVFVGAEQAPEAKPFPDTPGAYVVKNARRLWSWEGANECIQVARKGVSDGRCSMPSGEMTLFMVDTAEVHPMTEEALATIDALPHWVSGDDS